MRTEEMKTIIEEYNIHIDNLNAINEWFKDMNNALNETVEQ